jgi:hypothetical protein
MVSCREDNARVLDDDNDAMMHRPTSHELHTLAMLYIGNGCKTVGQTCPPPHHPRLSFSSLSNEFPSFPKLVAFREKRKE